MCMHMCVCMSVCAHVLCKCVYAHTCMYVCARVGVSVCHKVSLWTKGRVFPVVLFVLLQSKAFRRTLNWEREPER